MRDASRRLVEAYRTHEVPDDATVEAMLERLVEQEPASPRPWGRVATSIGLAVALAAAVLLLLRGGFMVLGVDAHRRTPDAAMREHQRSTPPATTTRRSETSPPASTPVPAVEPPEEIREPSEDIEAPAAPERRTPRTPNAGRAMTSPAETSASADELREEARLLAAAQAALAAGSPERALVRLDEHRRAHPKGVMVLERMALRAIALCQADAQTEGRDVARRLFSEHPQAPHRTRVRRACGELELPPADAP